MLKGRIYPDSDDGRVVYSAGDAFYWAPGHVPGSQEASEYVDYAPKTEFRELIDHVKQAMAVES